VAFGAGKVLVGLDSGDTDFDTVLETGGAKTSTTGSTTLTTSQTPAHSHKVAGGEYDSGSYDFGTNFQVNNLVTNTATKTYQADTSSVGGGGGHTHGSTPTVQPYIVVYFWKRTA
tara:strand:- start:1036 stop:1380 length:345 start_codon:yes stop_codon:yes gene_type:complete